MAVLPNGQSSMTASNAKSAMKPDRRRRRHPRYLGQFGVGVTVLLGNRYEKLDGHCKDLSTAGIGILLAAEMNPGEVVGLSFTIPGAAPWEIRAVLRYRRGYHYGFEFLSLLAEQQQTLDNYLKNLTPID
jgi:hypothetical protein